MKKKTFKIVCFILAFVITLQVFIPPKPSYASPGTFAMKKATLYFFGGILSPWVASAVATAGACYTIYEVGKYLKEEHVGQKIKDYWSKLTDSEKEYIEQNIESSIDGDEIDMTKIDKRIIDGYSSTMFEGTSVSAQNEIKGTNSIYNNFTNSYIATSIEYFNSVPNLGYEIVVEGQRENWFYKSGDRYQRNSSSIIRDDMLPGVRCNIKIKFSNVLTGQIVSYDREDILITNVGSFGVYSYGELRGLDVWEIHRAIKSICSKAQDFTGSSFTLPINSVSFYPPLSDTMPKSISLPDRVKIEDKDFDLKGEIPIPAPIVGGKTIEIDPTKPIDNPIDKPTDKPTDPPVTKPTSWDWLKDLLKDILDAIKSIPGLLGNVVSLLKDILNAIKSLATPTQLDMSVPNKIELDFSPLYINLKEKFPFCIPFDIVKSIKSFSVDAKEPVFVIPLSKTGWKGAEDFTIDLTGFEKIIIFVRYTFLVSFLFYLLNKTRSLIRG